MHVDPNAWLLTLPLTILLIQAYRQPERHALARLWRKIVQLEAMAMAQFGWAAAWSGSRLNRVLFQLIVAALGVTSLASLGVFVGVLPAA